MVRKIGQFFLNGGGGGGTIGWLTDTVKCKEDTETCRGLGDAKILASIRGGGSLKTFCRGGEVIEYHHSCPHPVKNFDCTLYSNLPAFSEANTKVSHKYRLNYILLRFFNILSITTG